jgi:RNA polymerase sigma-70 factor (ECF subfamily)
VTIERLYARYRGLVYGLALRYGAGNGAWAEDVMQDVFVGLFKHVDRLRDLDSLEGWFYRVTTNRCLNKLRRERFWERTGAPRLLHEPRESVPMPDALCQMRSDLADAMRVVATSLPPKEKVAFCMYHLDGKTQLEIGEILGHSKGYICKLIHRAEGRVRKLGFLLPEGGAGDA